MRVKLFSTYFNIILSAFLLMSCSDESVIAEKPGQNSGGPAIVEVSLDEFKNAETRAVRNSYDKWGIESFQVGDGAGIYTRGGYQNPDNPDDYSLPLENGLLYCEGTTSGSSSRYRFSNGDVILNPTIVSNNYSIMYYPYYKDMPTAEGSASLPGMPLRVLDETDGIEKCIDFMQTTHNYSASGYYAPTHKLTLSSGVLSINFKHYFSELIIQRGKEFDNPKDPRVWVVMKAPCTDIRIKRSSNYTYNFQNLLDDGKIITLPESNPAFPDDENQGSLSLLVNKYRVWEAWEGNPYNGKNSYYVIIPPREVEYIFIQDNYEKWHAVYDFYLYEQGDKGNKTAKYNNKYVVNVSMKDLNPVVRPVSIVDWVTGEDITDQRSVGISGADEYITWVSLYNTYMRTVEKDPELEKELVKYGTGERDKDGKVHWTFYINGNIDYRLCNNAYINRLDDKLMGSSVYENYTISNLQAPWIGEMTENGSISSLDFTNLYIVDLADGEYYSGGLVRKMTGGEINNCNVVNGVIVSNKNSGMAAGYIDEAKILNSSFSGEVIGIGTSVSYPGLFGINPTKGVELNSISYSGLNFENY